MAADANLAIDALAIACSVDRPRHSYSDNLKYFLAEFC